MKKENWDNFIGDVAVGRKNLGELMPVSVYRLFEFTMKDTLIEFYGEETAIEIFRKAGKSAGIRFAENFLDLNTDFSSFVAQTQKIMKELKVGIFRLEEVNTDKNLMTIAISEDLDCSGMPVSDETVCNYDEGFLSGILKVYTGEDYIVREIDCWANGGRVCRFQAHR